MGRRDPARAAMRDAGHCAVARGIVPWARAVDDANRAPPRVTMSSRLNFSSPQKASALRENANWLRTRGVSGVELTLHAAAVVDKVPIYYCENCHFCHTDAELFDVDHFVPDKHFRLGGRVQSSVIPENMAILCKSTARGDLGCNQSKGARLWVPRGRGLAVTRPDLDLNCCPLRDRPFPFSIG